MVQRLAARQKMGCWLSQDLPAGAAAALRAHNQQQVICEILDQDVR